jgi:hypothetical protein
LVIEPLERGRREWEISKDCDCVTGEEPQQNPFYFRHLRHAFGDSRIAFTARQRATYVLEKTEKNLVEIAKRFELATHEQAGGAPRVRSQGEGRFYFDLEEGLPESGEMSLTVSFALEGDERHLPVKVTWKRLAVDELERALAPQAVAPAGRRELQLTEAEFEQSLADLESGDPFRIQAACDQLAKIKPGGPHSEIVDRLTMLVEDRDVSVRLAAIKAMGTWGDADEVPVLIESLDDESHAVRWAAFESLGKFRNERGAAAVAKWLSRDRNYASRALIAMGPVAEPAVLALFDVGGSVTGGGLRDSEASDNATRAEACRILQQIGNDRSLSVLKTAAESSDFLLRTAAGDALRAIRARTMSD